MISTTSVNVTTGMIDRRLQSILQSAGVKIDTTESLLGGIINQRSKKCTSLVNRQSDITTQRVRCRRIIVLLASLVAPWSPSIAACGSDLATRTNVVAKRLTGGHHAFDPTGPNGNSKDRPSPEGELTGR